MTDDIAYYISVSSIVIPLLLVILGTLQGCWKGQAGPGVPFDFNGTLMVTEQHTRWV